LRGKKKKKAAPPGRGLEEGSKKGCLGKKAWRKREILRGEKKKGSQKGEKKNLYLPGRPFTEGGEGQGGRASTKEELSPEKEGLREKGATFLGGGGKGKMVFSQRGGGKGTLFFYQRRSDLPLKGGGKDEPRTPIWGKKGERGALFSSPAEKKKEGEMF